MAVNLRHHFPSGITSRIGVILIAGAVLVMGIVVYAVWNQSQEAPVKPFSILVDEQIAIKQGVESPLYFNVQSTNITDNIQITVSASEGVSATVKDSQLQAGIEGTVTLLSTTNNTEGQVTLSAKQGNEQASATVTVRIIPSAVNSSTNSTNTSSNTNTPSNTNTQTNTNTPVVDADHLRFINKDLRISFVYPIFWGKVIYPELVKMKAVSGKVIHARYENLDRLDLAGHSFVTATTDDYVPSVRSGTPFYFAGNIDPSLPLDQITQQIQAAGFKTFHVEIVELGGRKAVKMFYYRNYTHHFLDVAYLYHYPKGDGLGTLMLSRTIERLGFETLAEDQALELGKDVYAKLQDGTLSSETLRRYREFEDAMASLQFIQ